MLHHEAVHRVMRGAELVVERERRVLNSSSERTGLKIRLRIGEAWKRRELLSLMLLFLLLNVDLSACGAIVLVETEALVRAVRKIVIVRGGVRVLLLVYRHVFCWNIMPMLLY